MKFLRSLAAFVLIAVVVIFSSCSGEKPSFFELNSLPDISADFEQEMVLRADENFVGEFKTNSSGEKLIPFAGALNDCVASDDSSSSNKKTAMYGLATVDGKIVVDPVYPCVLKRVLKDKTVLYELIKGADYSAPDAERIIISENGSWSLKLNSKMAFVDISGDGLFCIKRERTIRRNKKNVNIYY